MTEVSHDSQLDHFFKSTSEISALLLKVYPLVQDKGILPFTGKIL